MLSVRHRFHGHGSLRYVYKNGRAIRSRLFIIKAVTNSRRRHSRVAVVVSKKVLKSAVGRNRIRRRIYEIVRKRLSDIEVVGDIAIIVTSSEVRTMPSDELYVVLVEMLHQTDLYKNQESTATIIEK